MKRENGKKHCYKNGYWPKVEYWSGLLETAIKQNDSTGALLCSSKLEFFTGKQKELEDNLKEI